MHRRPEWHSYSRTGPKGIVRQLERMKKSESLPDQVRLRGSLNGEHWYVVQLHWDAAQSLMLNVLSTTDSD